MPSKRLQSPGVQRVLAGLKAVADQQGLAAEGRFVAFSMLGPGRGLTGDGDRDTVMLGVCPGHPGNDDYQAVFPPVQNEV